jgi:hypothetical protein
MLAAGWRERAGIGALDALIAQSEDVEAELVALLQFVDA